MRRKFESIKGSFPCKYCGTIYQWSDQRDKCEGTEHYREKPYEFPVLDELEVEVGDEVLLTRYVGEDYAPAGYKCGIHLVWRYAKVKDKRIVPGSFSHYGDKYLHYAEYKIDEEQNSKIIEILGERWDVSECQRGGLAAGIFLGPRHIWTEALVRRTTSNPWEEYVRGQCAGPDTPETLQKLADESFCIYGVNYKL